MNPAPPHVLTLTCNLLAERTLEFASWQPGRTQRAVGESFQVGGKGINVTKMLRRLGHPSTALYFPGGAPGAECEAWLERQQLPRLAFPTTVPTRSGTVVRVRDAAQAETTFLGPDAPPDAAAIRAAAEFLTTRPDGGVLTLSGSAPGWNEASFAPLRSALENWLARGTLVVDSYGPPLEWAARRPVALIKINADELRTLGGREAALKNFPSVARWIVSDGGREVWLRDEHGREHVLVPPSVHEISPTGSGDVLLACVLHAWLGQRRDLREAVRFALPYAAANAAHPGVAEFPEPAAGG